MRVLVSGAAGFLGFHLCGKLLSAGHSVIGLDNFVTGSTAHIAELAKNPSFSFVQQDVSTHISVTGRIDAVLHFASPASPNPLSPYGYPNLPIQTMKAGALGTHNMLGVARANHAIFLLASTSEVYGDPKIHPQDESYWGHVDPIGERSVYDEAKRFAEALTMAYRRYHQIDTRIARIFNTYGPHMRTDDGRVVPNFINQAIEGKPLTIYGDGLQTRSFCYVDDLVEGICLLLNSQEHLPVNLGNPEEISIIRFAEKINQITNNPAGIVFKKHMLVGHDPSQRQPDISKAVSLLGWTPKISLEEGLGRTIAYFKHVPQNEKL